ncbi:MAG: phenylacetate--CoA ligase family protein [Desulfobacterota bacterium]|nr:phenylacetate--CoA ligase family protein [Thermodesulfobacteriota bacterium]MDW8001879.1 phenylacetate--CoA ligase family protein [Deltaproteobacteria bacterium]
MAERDSIYWNPILETMPKEKLRELQIKKFKRIFEWAYNNSPFYRRLYKEAGIEPEDIKSYEDIKKVPKIDKGMLRDVQTREPFPYGDILAVPLREVVVFRQTSGTTGTPVYQADTWQDWEWWSECWAYILYAQGYREEDRVFLPFGYNVFVAFWAAHYAAEKIGCEVVPGGVLDTEARILKMQELKCTAFAATPTYVLGMADTARKMGIDPRSLGIKRITCAGEPGASIPATKKRIEEAWGAKVYDHAGATEIGAWGYMCTEQTGLHVNEAFFLVEIEDVETGEIVEEPMKNGKMIVTAFDRYAKPCIRFDSKDIIRWANYDCPCGRTFRLIDGGVIGRADDITKVKGVLLAPTAIEEVVRSFKELSNEYEVIVSKKGDIDDILLKIEILPEYESKREDILSRLKDQLRLKTNLGYRIEVHPFGSLPRYDVKAKRFKDLRKQ